MGGSMDWNLLAERYRQLKIDLSKMVLPSKTELRRRQIELAKTRDQTPGLSTLWEWGERTYPRPGTGSGSDAPQRQTDAWEEQVSRFNEDLEGGGAIRAATDVALPGYEGLSQACFDVLEAGFAARRISTQFVLAWGYLSSLAGRRHELLALEGLAKERFLGAEKKGLSQATAAQELWYALWVVHHTQGDATRREEVEMSLAAMCSASIRGARPLPSGFDKDWFRKVIRLEPKSVEKAAPHGKKKTTRVPEKGTTAEVSITTSFLKLSWNTLLELASEASRHRDSLPPVEKSAYRRTSRRHP